LNVILGPAVSSGEISMLNKGNFSRLALYLAFSAILLAGCGAQCLFCFERVYDYDHSILFRGFEDQNGNGYWDDGEPFNNEFDVEVTITLIYMVGNQAPETLVQIVRAGIFFDYSVQDARPSFEFEAINTPPGFTAGHFYRFWHWEDTVGDCCGEEMESLAVYFIPFAVEAPLVGNTVTPSLDRLSLTPSPTSTPTSTSTPYPPTPTPSPTPDNGGGVSCNPLAATEDECPTGLWNGFYCDCSLLCSSFTSQSSCEAHADWDCEWSGGACIIGSG
jgi:hypothetical protein